MNRKLSTSSSLGFAGKLLGLAALLGVAFAPVSGNAAMVTGTVKLDGAAPNYPAPNLTPDCKGKRKDALPTQTYVTGAGNTLGNVVVYVKSGGKKATPPAEMAVIDQQGCEYHPHVTAMVAGQKLEVKNSDGLMHNVHSMGKANGDKNNAMPPARKTLNLSLTKPEFVKVKCDVHPWMLAYIAVMDTPHFAVTKADGKFSLDLEPGTYEIAAWHGKSAAEPKVTKVTVPATGSVTADFVLPVIK